MLASGRESDKKEVEKGGRVTHWGIVLHSAGI